MQARYVLAIAVFGLLASLSLLNRAWAAPSRQVIDQSDVSTPTPAFDIILVPTPIPGATPAIMPAAPFAAQAEGGEVPEYVVRDGDTLFTVALEIGVDLATMPCAVSPFFQADQPLVVGDTLTTPPPGWVCHAVAPSETLSQVVAQYDVDARSVRAVSWNQIPPELADDAPLTLHHLRIPRTQSDAAGDDFLTYMLAQPVGLSPVTVFGTGGPRQAKRPVAGPVPKDWPYGSGSFAWPVYGWLSQGYRYDHPALDIAAATGTFVTAADRGVVIRAGWNEQGYGLFVVIDHNIDYLTLYSHLDEVFVKEGEVVAQGQILGTVGSSGNATGPHLHFEIRDFGRRTNPLELLTR